MAKNTRNAKIRQPYDAVRVMAIKKVAALFQVSDMHVRSCIRGDYTYGSSDEIRKQFAIEYEKIKAVAQLHPTSKKSKP